MLPIIILFAGLISLASWWSVRRNFEARLQSDIGQLFLEARLQPANVVTQSMLDDLPVPIRRYLQHAGIVGKPIPHTVRLKQRGRIRPDPQRGWMPIDAEEVYSVNPPAFVWVATVTLGGVPLLRGRDMYRGGKGNMLIRLGGLVDVVNAAGDAITQAALMRYLSEIVEFPAAFLCDNIRFEAVDQNRARVTLSDCGRSVSGTICVDDEGRLTDFIAQRYLYRNGAQELRTWSTPITSYGVFEGLRLPSGGKAVWKLPDGDLEYVDVAISDVQYDAATPY